MIAKNCNDPTTQALVQLSAMPVQWHPCGSRYFGDATDASDFDFFAERTPVAQNYLVIHGFTGREVAKYMDVNTVSIFEKGRVHAIFVRSVEARLRAQAFLKNLSKKKRRSVKQWNTTYRDLAPDLLPQ